MKGLLIAFLFLIHSFILPIPGNGQLPSPELKDNSIKEASYQHSFSTDPLLILFNSFAMLYGKQKGEGNEFLLGFWYGKSNATYPKLYEYPGHIENYSVIMAYRKYFWRNLHAEYQLYPGYSRFFNEESQDKSGSFSLFNELRAGYRFDFHLGGIPLMLNVQWPVGFTLFETNEPPEFREVRKKDPVFYIFYPNLYLGVRF